MIWMSVAVFLDVTACSLVHVYVQTNCAVCCSWPQSWLCRFLPKRCNNFYAIARRHIPQDRTYPISLHLYTRGTWFELSRIPAILTNVSLCPCRQFWIMPQPCFQTRSYPSFINQPITWCVTSDTDSEVKAHRGLRYSRVVRGEDR